VCTNVGQFFDFVISYITSSPDVFKKFQNKTARESSGFLENFKRLGGFLTELVVHEGT
jgi:hypothetical protein